MTRDIRLTGYERTTDVAADLVHAVLDVLVRYPEQRLGQILWNALRLTDGTPMSTRLFNLHDEDLAVLLRAYAAADL